MTRRPRSEAQALEPRRLRFFVGLHQPSDARHFDAAFISINRLRLRKSAFIANDWILDSGAYSEVSTHGGYRHSVGQFASEIRRWSTSGNLLAAVSQDFMCEADVVERTGLSVRTHQRLTVERYDALRACDTAAVYVMPVLQGFSPADYVRSIADYGSRLRSGMWVGVGSVCKRNADPRAVEDVLVAIHRARRDLRLHGFGLKTTALRSGIVRQILSSADSMAWSFGARRNGRDRNDWREAKAWLRRIERAPWQSELPWY